MISNARTLVLATMLVGGAGACDSCGASSSPDASPGTDADSGDAASASEMGAAIDAAAACSGSALDLAAVVGDRACAITSVVARSTRAVFEMAEDAGKQSLKQEAVRLDDGRVEVRLVNKGTLATTVPLSWHPKIPAFLVLADNPKEKAIYELEAPPLAVDLDGGVPIARFARATIAPGGYAFARFAIDPKIVGRAGKAAADAGPPPAMIGEGKWTLHIGQLVTDVYTGEPASLAWVIEAKD